MTEIVLNQISVTDRLSAAREKLVTPTPRAASSMKALGAAALAAFAALSLAAAVILGPGVEDHPAAHMGGR